MKTAYPHLPIITLFLVLCCTTAQASQVSSFRFLLRGDPGSDDILAGTGTLRAFLSPDGKTAVLKSDERFQVNGRVYDGRLNHLLFSRDGRGFFLAYDSITAGDRAHYCWLGGMRRAGKVFDSCADACASTCILPFITLYDLFTGKKTLAFLGGGGTGGTQSEPPIPVQYTRYIIINGNREGVDEVNPLFPPGARNRNATRTHAFWYSLNGTCRLWFNNMVQNFDRHFTRTCISPDGSAILTVESRQGKDVVKVNGREFGPYERVVDYALNGDGTAYAFSWESGEGHFVRVNDETFGPFEHASFAVSANGYGRSIGFYCREKGGDYLNIGGKRFGPIPPPDIELSSLRGGKNEFIAGFQTYRLAVDDPGTQFVLAYRRGGAHHVRVNGKNYGPFNNAESPFITFDGKPGFLFIPRGARQGASSMLWLNGRVSGPVDPARDLFFTNDRRLCWRMTSDGNAKYCVINDRRVGPFDFTEDPVPVQDYRQFCFAFRRGGGNFIATHDAVLGPNNHIGPAHFYSNPPNNRLTYFYRAGRGILVLNDNGRDVGSFRNVREPQWSRDHSVLTFSFSGEGETGKRYVWLNGTRHGPYPEKSTHVLAPSGSVFVLVLGDDTVRVEEITAGARN
ncbi:MAG: hypothetical protein KBA61_14025 [Spirochaetes bacterium]|nr:hypothetical protein [Spirochaetota bacterium]